MEDWIAGLMAVLGVLLVLGGAAVLVLRAMNTPASAPDDTTAPIGTGVPDRGWSARYATCPPPTA